MELPAEATAKDRMGWALLSAIVGIIHDGPDNYRPLERLEAACKTFGVPSWDFDACARRLDFHYYRPWDVYFDKETYLEVSEREALGSCHLH